MIVYIGNYLSSSQKTPNFNIYLTAKFEEMGYEVVRSSSKKYWIPRLIDMLLTIFIHRKKATYIYIDTFSSKAFWFAYLSARLAHFFDIPYFTIVRGGDMEQRIKSSPKITTWLFTHSKENISPSLYLEHVLHNKNIRATYIPNFLDIASYPFKKRSIFGPKIYWVRSIHEIYQPVMACEIVNQLKVIYPNILLTMVGPNKDGSIHAVNKYIKDHKLFDHIRLTGKLSKNEWHELAKNHDIFLNTTSVDNHPVSVIEAMALGLPIVSTNAGGLAYLLKSGEDSLMTDSNDLEGLCKHIETILCNPGLGKELAAHARAKVEKFDWKYIEPEYRKLMA